MCSQAFSSSIDPRSSEDSHASPPIFHVSRARLGQSRGVCALGRRPAAEPVRGSFRRWPTEFGWRWSLAPLGTFTATVGALAFAAPVLRAERTAAERSCSAPLDERTHEPSLSDLRRAAAIDRCAVAADLIERAKQPDF